MKIELDIAALMIECPYDHGDYYSWDPEEQELTTQRREAHPEGFPCSWEDEPYLNHMVTLGDILWWLVERAK